MKKLYFLFLVLFTHLAYAQVPQGIPYQAAARNASGQALVNTAVKVRFSILDSVATGTLVYKETHSTTTNTVGLFNVNVGMGTPVTGTFSSINWGKNAKFMQMELDITGTGSNYVNMGTQQMLSVPYALYAGNGISMNGNNIGDMLYWDGMKWNNVAVGANGMVLTLSNSIPTWTFASFTNISPPSVATNSMTAISSTSASITSTVSSNGGSGVLSEGVVWSTSSNPAINLTSKTNDGTSVGTYSSTLTGLSPNTTYYVRAYSTNISGTSYGSQVVFTTAPVAIGQSYGGGILAYVLLPSDAGYSSTQSHGLIAHPTDFLGAWLDGCTGGGVYGTLATIGAGSGNTSLIKSKYQTGCFSLNGPSYLCSAYYITQLNTGGYTDWFLPSQNEMIAIYNNRSLIGSFQNSFYWSSTGDPLNPGHQAYAINFNNLGSAVSLTRYLQYPSRPIRTF
ncbi:MAG: hypothetical protein ORN56_07755 [Chitinophagales bacterium]|nr:hypothetical protein [Chitinophagales bacterium]